MRRCFDNQLILDLAAAQRRLFPGTAPEGLLQYRASGLAIVTAAIALWNTVYLGRALDDLRRGGEIIPDPLLAHLAPVGWQHINLTGDYLWDADTHLAPDGFRQLRAPAAITAHAA